MEAGKLSEHRDGLRGGLREVGAGVDQQLLECQAARTGRLDPVMEESLDVGDVLLRRTRLGLLASRELCAHGEEAPLRVARAMGCEAGWDGVRVRQEAARFRTEADAEGLVV